MNNLQMFSVSLYKSQIYGLKILKCKALHDLNLYVCLGDDFKFIMFLLGHVMVSNIISFTLYKD